ncbi:hypothetical protein BJY52DRAFT_936364 [Lactarius psammicola]|nr:hypothetical protein BJY52DRAFT_936364 [Lactarius psammicola]
MTNLLQSTSHIGVACSGPHDPRFALSLWKTQIPPDPAWLRKISLHSPTVPSCSVDRARYLYIYRPCPRLNVSQAIDLAMSKKPEHLSFPQPFDSTGVSNSTQNAAGAPEQRSIGPTQIPAYSPEIQSPRGTPNFMQTPNAPPGHSFTHISPYQPIQGPVRTHPTFPMPQVPQVQDTRVPTTHSLPPLPAMQRNESTYMHGHLNNTQVTPGPYSSYPPQALVMSYPPSQHYSGMSGPAHTAPLAQRNQVDSDDEGYEVDRGYSTTHNGDMRPKGPPSCFASGGGYCIPSDLQRTLTCISTHEDVSYMWATLS